MPRARSACYPIPNTFSIALYPWSSAPLLFLWLFPLTWVLAASGSPAVSAGASNMYLLARSGLAPLALLGCLCWVPALFLFAAVPCCGLGRAA